MKNIFLAIAIITFSLSCKAQSIISLEQAAIYNKSDEGLPETVTYVKDINNRLDQFVGTWKGSYGGKNFVIKFIKLINYGEYSVKWDEIIGNLLITDNNGNVLHNSFNTDFKQAGNLKGYNFQNRSYVLGFVANSYCNDSGDVFIEVRKNNPNEMTLYFMRDTGIYDPKKCPSYSSYVPLLPEDKMTLIKQ